MSIYAHPNRLHYSPLILSRAWPIVHLADCSDGRLSRWWEQPMLRPMSSVTDCLLNKPNVAIWLWTQLYQYHTRAWPMAHLPDVPIANCENSRLWVLPIVYWIRLNKSHLAIWLWTQLYQSCPLVTKMVTGSINLVHGNRILSSFYHFAYWKLHNYDKKCLVSRGCGKEGQFIRVYYHVQSRPGIMIVGPTR